MKFLHLADLHLGRPFHGYSIFDMQEKFLQDMEQLVLDRKLDAVVISGDLYDKPVATLDAMKLLEDFLLFLKEHNIAVLIISGNHDSAERLSFGSEIMKESGIYISRYYTGTIDDVVLQDEYGPIHFHLMPFFRPQTVRNCYPEETIDDFNDAVSVAMKHMNVNFQERNVLLMHQYVTGTYNYDYVNNDGDTLIGGTEAVDAELLESFDYVALGHVHRPQKVGRDTIRYSGTPLAYSLAEVGKKKSVVIVDIQEKGNTQVEQVPVTPLYASHKLTGTFMELTNLEFQQQFNKEDFYYIILTDVVQLTDPFKRLQYVYPKLLTVDMPNLKAIYTGENFPAEDDTKNIPPLEIAKSLFAEQQKKELSPEQEEYLQELIDQIWEGGSMR